MLKAATIPHYGIEGREKTHLIPQPYFDSFVTGPNVNQPVNICLHQLAALQHSFNPSLVLDVGLVAARHADCDVLP
jgi:hypothetical protein